MKLVILNEEYKLLPLVLILAHNNFFPLLLTTFKYITRPLFDYLLDSKDSRPVDKYWR